MVSVEKNHTKEIVYMFLTEETFQTWHDIENAVWVTLENSIYGTVKLPETFRN